MTTAVTTKAGFAMGKPPAQIGANLSQVDQASQRGKKKKAFFEKSSANVKPTAPRFRSPSLAYASKPTTSRKYVRISMKSRNLEAPRDFA